MDLDVVFLSRLQFALTIMFHYLFPPLTIGMGVVLVYLEGMYLRTRDPIYETAAKFWTSLFAVSFAMGVATGIVMEFQFGTNWAPYSRFVGDVFGSALAAEGIFAFFLESGSWQCWCLDGNGSAPFFTSSRRRWLRPVQSFPRFGSSSRIAGNKRRRAIKS